ncbi:MAG: NYN domain-containing protein [Rhizobiaceae bacterium]|jgi:uncharacterized LabA/DUF88 family protein
MIRSAFFIDGFNFYHALRKLDGNHLKWVSLRALMARQTSKAETIVKIYYFSAFADWLPGPRNRHQQYVAALIASDVTVIMGTFKKKDRYCSHCKQTTVGHEEKETDVNIALCMLNEAYKDTYDRAYLVSRDSDLKPAIAMIRAEFPHKEVVLVAPPHFGHSTDLLGVATGKRKITRAQIEECLFPERVTDSGGNVAAIRPVEYQPPTGVAPS